MLSVKCTVAKTVCTPPPEWHGTDYFKPPCNIVGQFLGTFWPGFATATIKEVLDS